MIAFLHGERYLIFVHHWKCHPFYTHLIRKLARQRQQRSQYCHSKLYISLFVRVFYFVVILIDSSLYLQYFEGFFWSQWLPRNIASIQNKVI
jgi:hypothetical protein